MRICKACAKENPDHIKSCLDCGRNVDPTAKKFRGVIYLASALTVGALIAFIIVRNPSFAPVKNWSRNEDPAPKTIAQAPVASAAVPKLPEERTKQSDTLTPAPTTPPAPIKIENHTAGTDAIEAARPTTSTASAPARPLPKERKRVQHQTVDTADILTGNTPANIKINGPLGGNLSGIKSSSEAYMRLLQHVIATEFNEALKKQNLPGGFGDRPATISLMVDSRSGEIEILKISTDLDSRKQEVLRTVIGQCSGRISCPRELYDDMGDHVKLDFPLALIPEENREK